MFFFFFVFCGKTFFWLNISVVSTIKVRPKHTYIQYNHNHTCSLCSIEKHFFSTNTIILKSTIIIYWFWMLKIQFLYVVFGFFVYSRNRSIASMQAHTHSMNRIFIVCRQNGKEYNQIQRKMIDDMENCFETCFR